MAAPVVQLHRVDAPEDAGQTEILPSPSCPLDVARVITEEMTTDGHLLLRRWRSDWWKYTGPHWTEVEVEALRQQLYMRLECSSYWAKDRNGENELKPWSPDKGKLDRLLDAMTATMLLSRDTDAPVWLSTGESAAGYVPCANGLVDVATATLLPATPDYFGEVALPFDYNPNAPEPVEWLKFLRTLWPPAKNGDADEVRALQQWFGYVLSGRLDLHKALLLVGPPRSGKGTIARILTALLGKPNVAAPTLASLATNFGLQPLIGKSLAVVGDARLQQHGQETVVERILSITGSDGLTVDRKNRTAWFGTIPARIMILSNELPRFTDASGAVASRFVILKLTEGFLGREDISLEIRLRAELPGILRWALDGLRQVNLNGRLTEPAASTEAVQQLADMVSPTKAFLREVCDIDGHHTTLFSAIYKEYREWCTENGRHPKNTSGFSSDLVTVLPTLKTDHRPRTADGRKMPRHIVGLRISSEWQNRVREKPSPFGWRGDT